jgi:DNA-binding transcriptional LysR family regulator
MMLNDVSLLPALVALLEAQSVSVAAQKCGVTQPAMSRTLQKLRDNLGDALLVRAGRGVVRTARGQALLAPAREALSAASRVLQSRAAFDPRTATGVVTIALGDDLQAMAAGAILAEMRKHAPGLDVRLRLLGHHTVDEARRGDVDVAVFPVIKGVTPPLGDLVLKRLYTRRFVTLSSTSRRDTLDSFCAADHVLVSPGGTDIGFVDDALKKIGRSRRVAVTVQSFTSALHVVKRSPSLLITLPDDVAKSLAPKLHVQQCPVATPTFPVSMCWHAQQSTDVRNRFARDRVGAAIRAVVT